MSERLVKIALAGYGNVGRAFHRIVEEQGDHIARQHGIRLKITGIARKDRFVVHPDGIPLAGERHWTPGNIFEMLGSSPAHVFVEATPTDLKTGQPAVGHVRGALREGLHVVMANKGPYVAAYDEVCKHAADAGRQLRGEATVAGCIPVLDTARHHFAGDPVERIEGILNGTSNFILSRMADEGSDLEQALREAQQLGYAETDPSADIDGLDAAAKVVILANVVLGRRIGLDDVDVTGIRGITRQAVELAGSHGMRIRLVAEVDSKTARVGPRLVPRGSPLDVSGALNAVRFTSRLAGQVTHVGAGAGGTETAAALLVDVIDVALSDNRPNVP